MIFVILGIIAGISTYVLALTLYFTLNKDEPLSYHHSNTQAGWLFLITYIYLYTIVEWWKNRIRSKIYIHVYEEIRERVEFRGLPQSGQKKGHSNIINYTSESLCWTIILNFDLDLIHFIQDCYVGLFVSDSSLMTCGMFSIINNIALVINWWTFHLRPVLISICLFWCVN